MSAPADVPVLCYDGECGLCAQSVQFVLRRESHAQQAALRFAPLQGEWARAMRARHPAIDGIDSVVWCEQDARGGERVLVRSSAALAALRHLGGVWGLLALAAKLVPRVVRDIVYDAIARRRTRWVARACLVPDAGQRARFLR